MSNLDSDNESDAYSIVSDTYSTISDNMNYLEKNDINNIINRNPIKISSTVVKENPKLEENAKKLINTVLPENAIKLINTVVKENPKLEETVRNLINNVVKESPNKQINKIIDEVKNGIMPEYKLPKRQKGVYTDNDQKYGDDEKFESAADNYIFFPIANQLVSPMWHVGLTPNMVTLMSTTMTCLCLYYIYINEKPFACIAYFLGYLLDCVDGKIARKYNMGSKLGMALDLVSDNFTHVALITYITSTKGYFTWYTPILVFMTYMIGLSYGLNEAIACYKINKNDDFYSRRVEELSTESGLIFDLFLMITKGSYDIYKFFFPTYDEEKIDKWLKILKHFGPGNFCIAMIFIIISY